MDTIYVTGHRNPDTDSIVSAMAYAALRNALGDREYRAARLGHVSDETQLVLDRFGFTAPTWIKNMRTQVRDLDYDTPPALSGAAVELVADPQREYALQRALAPVQDQYDYIFIDCPPSLGLLTVNALVAADGVIIPIQCEFYALEGVSQLMKTVELVRREMNRNLQITGVILSMFDGRTNLGLQVVQEVKRFFGNKVFKTVIPKNVRLAEAPSYGLSIVDYDPSSKGAKAYKKLADEFVQREGR